MNKYTVYEHMLIKRVSGHLIELRRFGVGFNYMNM